MKVKHNLPSELELGKTYEFKLEKVEDGFPIPFDNTLIQVKGEPPVYFMQEEKKRWVVNPEVLHDLCEDLGLDENERMYITKEHMEAIPRGKDIEKWPEELEYKIAKRGFMISGSGAPSISELKDVGINFIFDKNPIPIEGMMVFEWHNMINQVKPEGYVKQVMMNGQDVGSICPYAGKDFFPGFAKDIFDRVCGNGIDGFIGDGDRYVQQRGSDGNWYEGGYCQECRTAGVYGFEDSPQARNFKNTAIEEINRIFKAEAGSKKMGAFLWQGNIVDGSVVFAGMVGVGQPKVLGEILDFSIPMIYNNFEEFKILARAWRKEVPNDKLILALCWSASDCHLNANLLTEKVKWCEENNFNWCCTGNNQKDGQLSAIKKALNK